MALDLRLVKLTIEVNGGFKTYQDLYISASGTKYSNANQNECEIKIANVDKETANFILTETSPFNRNRTRKRVLLEAGRASYGTSRIYVGEITAAIPSQPPDVMITLKCLTGNFEKGNIISRTQPSAVLLSTLSQQVANDLSLALDFQAVDKQITNYNFTGGALKQVEKLGQVGFVNAFIDDTNLIIKDLDKGLKNKVRVIDSQSGMIGIPEITEAGIKVKYLLDTQTTLGGIIRVKSGVYPAVNGDYIIYKLGFDIANRETPFYWIAEARHP